MPNFVSKTLNKLKYKPKKKKQLAPHGWTIPIYRKNHQFAKASDTTSPILDKNGKTRVQSVVGSFLYYARAINNTILPALIEISFMQSQPTENTHKILLDYLHTYKDTKIRCYRSDMKLHVDSNTAYLVAPKAKSRIAGYCSDNNNNSLSPPLNGPLHVECKVL